MMVATDKIQNTFSIPKSVFPVVGGFTVGLIALRYPEVLYWGFDNVDTLLESRPFVKGLPVDLLLQLIGIKIVATSFCRACGLVGGYYAPSLFIGAATGMAYGKLFSIFHLSGIEVASPQAYGLVIYISIYFLLLYYKIKIVITTLPFVDFILRNSAFTLIPQVDLVSTNVV